MVKCFVIKLPVSVDNDNLPYFDSYELKGVRHLKTGGYNNIISYSGGGSILLKGNGNFYKDERTKSTSLGTVLTQGSGDSKIQFGVANADDDTTILVKNISDINGIEFFADNLPEICDSASELVSKCLNLVSYVGHNCTIKTSYLANLTKLKILEGSYNLTGDIASLSSLVNLTTLAISGGGNITGDIASLSSLVNLTTLRINTSGITGDIASLATEIAKAKKAHTLNITCNGVITNGSVTPAKGAIVTITFAADGTYTIS